MNKKFPVRSQGKVEMDKGEFELYISRIKLKNRTQIRKEQIARNADCHDCDDFYDLFWRVSIDVLFETNHNQS
jgi:hypothetical protein